MPTGNGSGPARLRQWFLFLKKHGKEVPDTLPPDIPVMAAFVFLPDTGYFVFLTEYIILCKLFPKFILPAHPAEKQTLLFLKTFFLHDSQKTVIRIITHKIMHETAEKPFPGKQLRMAADSYAGLHGSHGKAGHSTKFPSRLYPVFLFYKRNDILHQLLREQIMPQDRFLALADYLGIDMEAASRALTKFTGTDRRFEYKGCVEGITIVDDYAHHPTEITATLKAARNYPHQTLWCVFQPHTYTRTKAFLPEFAHALSLADKVILADIYPARETDTLGISSRSLQEIIVNSGTECHYFPDFEEIEKFILENCTPGDLLITMGAGDVVNIGENLLNK